MLEEQPKKYYTCKNDRAFKEVFIDEKDTSLLKALLESILKVNINSIEIKNTELNNNNIHSRRKLVDALLYTDQGVFNIEVNSYKEEYTNNRNFAFIANAYSNYTLKGKDYDTSINFIQINLSYEINTKEPLRVYGLMDKKQNTFIDNFWIYEFNMDKYLKYWYNKDEKEIEANKYLIMLDLPKEDLEVLSKKDKVVSNYMEKLDTVNEDPRFQSYMSAEEDDRKIMNSIKSIYYDKGVEQGIEQGIEQGVEQGIKLGIEQDKLEIATNLLKAGLDIKFVSENTGLSVKELEKIKI